MTDATRLLGIARPEALFNGDLAVAKRQYRDLARRWHPDRPSGDAVVAAHINHLYDAAVAKISAGTWEGAQTVRVTVKRTGAPIELPVLAVEPFPLGHAFIAEDSIAFAVRAEAYAYYRRGMLAFDVPGTFTYASGRMQAECSRYLPSGCAIEGCELGDGRWFVRIAKPPDLIRLRDIVTAIGPLDPRQTAWIVSRLLSLACYLTYAGIVHLDISPETYFVSPENHSGALLGGWWYWQKAGATLTTVPQRTFDRMPHRTRTTKTALPSIDLELIRATAIEISAPMPAPMRTWLHTPGSGSASTQYEAWMEVLTRTFGERRFVKMPITSRDVYGPLVTHTVTKVG